MTDEQIAIKLFPAKKNNEFTGYLLFFVSFIHITWIAYRTVSVNIG